MKHKGKIIFALIAIIIVSLIFYVVNFWGHKFSNTTETWGAFSDYLNPFIAISNLIVFIWLSFSVYEYNEKKDRQDEILKTKMERPVLVSSSDYHPHTNPQEVWSIKNVGNGAALNLLITTKTQRNLSWRVPAIKCFSLGKMESIELLWAAPIIDVICVIYEDIFENKYVTVFADDKSFTQPLNREYKKISIQNFTFEKEEILKILELRQERIHWARFNGPNAFS